MFIHDLIYFTGPIKLIELVEVLKIVFGDNPFKLTNNLAILTAFEFIRRNEEGIYKINTGKTYYRYKFDTNDLISTFRNYMFKGYPKRIYAD